ncbi:hypothetical protein ACLBX9_03265 [Methylobacterium sp. A49B]
MSAEVALLIMREQSILNEDFRLDPGIYEIGANLREILLDIAPMDERVRIGVVKLQPLDVMEPRHLDAGYQEDALPRRVPAVGLEHRVGEACLDLGDPTSIDGHGDPADGLLIIRYNPAADRVNIIVIYIKAHGGFLNFSVSRGSGLQVCVRSRAGS